MRLPLELRPTNRRVEAFSDGVFAIVVTIMVLEIRIPDSLAFANDRAALMQFASFSTTNFKTFADLAFRVTLTPAIVAKTVAFALAARLEIVDALRAT